MPRAARTVLAALLLALVAASPAFAASYNGRSVDGRWYEGKAVSTTYGAYDCRIQFHDNEVILDLSGLQIVGVLEEEVIVDPHEIRANDPKRGVDWTIDCFNLVK